MIFKNFRLNIIVRILVLLAAGSAFAWFIVSSEPIRAVYLGILILLLILELFHYTDRLNKDLNQFFLSIFHDDFTSLFPDRGRGRSFRQLYGTMNEITQKFKTLSMEKEMRSQYLFSLIDQIKVGIISYEPNGRVHLVNRAFNEMLDTPAVRGGTDLSEQEPELFSVLEMVVSGERQLIKRRILHEDREFSFVSSGFKIGEKLYNLVSVQDIREELDKREFEAWQKLIRVLTHEIMNSISPIISLTGSLHDLIHRPESSEGGKAMHLKLVDGLSAIKDRSEGLMRFTEAYQNLARIPAPVISEIQTKEFVGRIETLFRGQFESSRIEFMINIAEAPDFFHGDADLLEQVIINLIRNAVDAVRETQQPEIHFMISSRSDHKVSIRLRDNGKGIPDEIMDRIFVPFFSTKERGSGIGLSLSRQIILMHRGMLTVNSKTGQGSEFEIILG